MNCTEGSRLGLKLRLGLMSERIVANAAGVRIQRTVEELAAIDDVARAVRAHSFAEAV